MFAMQCGGGHLAQIVACHSVVVAPALKLLRDGLSHSAGVNQGGVKQTLGSMQLLGMMQVIVWVIFNFDYNLWDWQFQTAAFSIFC